MTERRKEKDRRRRISRKGGAPLRRSVAVQDRRDQAKKLFKKMFPRAKAIRCEGQHFKWGIYVEWNDSFPVAVGEYEGAAWVEACRRMGICVS